MIIIILSLLLLVLSIYYYKIKEPFYNNQNDGYNQNNNPTHNYVMCLPETREYKQDLQPIKYSNKIFKVEIGDDDDDKHKLDKKCRPSQLCGYTFKQGNMLMAGFKDSDINKFFPKALTPNENQHPNKECQFQFKNSNIVPYLLESTKDLNNILIEYKNGIQQLETKIAPLKKKLGILKKCVQKIDNTNRCKLLYEQDISNVNTHQ